MKTFFKNASKVSITSLVVTISISLALVGLLNFAGSDVRIIQVIGKVLMPIMLITLMMNPLAGFIYSFFMKGKMKIVMILLHLACVCTVSFFAFISIMFRYFVPFAP